MIARCVDVFAEIPQEFCGDLFLFRFLFLISLRLSHQLFSILCRNHFPLAHVQRRSSVAPSFGFVDRPSTNLTATGYDKAFIPFVQDCS